MAREQVTHADVRVELHVELRVKEGGGIEVKHANGYDLPPIIARPLTKAELRSMPEARGDKWYGGGISPSAEYTANGQRLTRSAISVADVLIRQLKTLVLRYASGDPDPRDRVLELLCQYGAAKFGDEWWPGNAAEWIGADGAELAALLDPGAAAQADAHAGVEVLANRAADIMADQQAMPDPGGLEAVREVVREAFRLGKLG